MNLEKVLSAAKDAGVAVIGFDELGLPAPRPAKRLFSGGH
jgi:hypothetical protein